jgi:hypothetical protein
VSIPDAPIEIRVKIVYLKKIFIWEQLLLRLIRKVIKYYLI